MKLLTSTEHFIVSSSSFHASVFLCFPPLAALVAESVIVSVCRCWAVPELLFDESLKMLPAMIWLIWCSGPAVNNYIFGGGLRARLRHKRISSLKYFRILLKDFYLGSWYWYGSTEMSKLCPKIHLQKHEKQKGVDRSPGNFRQKKSGGFSDQQRAACTVHKSLIEGLWPVSQKMPLFNGLV